MAKPFNDLLSQQRNGALHSQLSDNLAELVQAVMETGKAGAITLTLKVAPNGENSVRVTDEVKVKVPEAAKGFGWFFVDAGGNLLREDPRQDKLPFREVASAAPTQIREAVQAQPAQMREAIGG